MKFLTYIVSLLVLLNCLQFILTKNYDNTRIEDFMDSIDNSVMSKSGSGQVKSSSFNNLNEIVAQSEESIDHGLKYEEIYVKLRIIRHFLVNNIEALIKPIVYKIHNGNTELAATILDEIDSELVLVQVIQAAYTIDCELTEVQIQSNILDVLKLLFKTSHLKVGFDELHRIVKKNRETLNSVRLCLIHKRLQGPLIGIDIDELTYSEIKDLSSTVKDLIEKSNLNSKCKISKKTNLRDTINQKERPYNTKIKDIKIEKDNKERSPPLFNKEDVDKQKHLEGKIENKKKNDEIKQHNLEDILEDEKEIEEPKHQALEEKYININESKSHDKSEIKQDIVNVFKGDLKNFDNALKHINTIKNPDKAINITVELLTDMKNNQHSDTNELIQLVLNLKLESDRKGKIENESIKTVPPMVHELVWKGNENELHCWVKNKGSGKYLLSNHDVMTDGLRQISAVTEFDMVSNGNWHFESIALNDKFWFQIRNTRFNENLIISEKENNTEVLTKSGICNSNDCYWNILPAENATYLQIKNKAADAFLSIQDDHVVVIKSDSIIHQEDIISWSLDCKKNKERFKSIYEESNLKQALKFVDSIQDHEEKIEALTEVLKVKNNKQNSSDLIQITYLMKQELESVNNSRIAKDEVLNEVPEQVQELLWKGSKTDCWLKNRKTLEYLYANESSNFQFNRIVFGQQSKLTDSLANWNFIPSTVAKHIYFYIYSTRFNEILVRENKNEEIVLFTTKSNSTSDDSLWELISVEDGKYLQIWSKYTQEVLAIDEKLTVEGNKRPVVLKKGDILIGEITNTHWTLECRNDSERILELYKKNDEQVEDVITFVKSIQSPEHFKNGIITINNELKNNNKTEDIGMIQLSQLVQNGTVNSALTDNLRDIFTESVQELIWKGQDTNCWLNNKAYNEYLYLSPDEEEPRQLITIVPEYMDSFGNWLFLPKGNFSTFHIFNPRLNESIQNSIGSHNTKSILTIKTINCTNDCDWIIATAYGGKYVQIKNILNGHLLYVDSEQEDDKRHVYTIDPKTLSEMDIDHTLWTLKCRNDFERTHELYSGNASYVERTLIFIKSLESNKDIVHRTDQLIKEMIRLKHVDTTAFVQVAYFVKSVVNKDKENIDLRSYFSPIIQELIWKGSEINCWIKNKVQDEYFYIADQYNDKGRYVFTWIPGDVGTEGNWLFKPNNLANTFRIRNSLYHEDLRPLEERSSKEAIRMVTTYVSNSCGKKCDWEIIPAEDATYIQIRNGNQNEYLVADDAYFEGSRSIFTIPLESVNSTNQTFWTITCQTDSERIQSTYNSDLSNFNKSFAYVRSIQDKDKTRDGIAQILEVMTNHSHLDNIQLIRLANFAKEHMDFSGYNETIQKQFPKIVQDIIWMKNDSKCWIIGEVNEVKLLDSDSNLHEKDHLVVASISNIKDGGMNWKFIAQDKNGGFMIQNSRSEKMLSYSKSEIGKPRILLTNMDLCGEECQWKTIPTLNAKFIQIMTSVGNEVINLEEVDFNGIKNLSLTHESKNQDIQESNTYWTLDCKNDKDRIASIYEGTKDRFNQTFHYIKSLLKPIDVVNGIQLLKNLLEEYDQSNSNEMLQLAFYAKDLEKIISKDLKYLFPTMVQNLVWADPNSTCWLKNEATNTYLSSDHTINNNKQRIVFTVIHDLINKKADWILKPLNGGQSYHIFNAGTDEHLQFVLNGTDQLIITFNDDSCKEECKWTIIPIDDKHIQISFLKTKEILMVGPNLNSTTNLNLISESSTDSNYNYTLWSLDCQSDTDRIPRLYNRSLSNFKKSMNFIKSLSEPQERAATLSLMKQMKSSQHLNSTEFLQLASWMKDRLKMHSDDETVRGIIPTIVKDLIWKEVNLTCWLKHLVSGKYLMVSDEQIGMKVQKVFVKGIDELKATANWDIQFDNFSAGMRFSNSLFLGDLSVSNESNGIPYTTIDSTCGFNCFWDVFPSSDGDSMLIRHRALDKYLHVLEQDHQPVLILLNQSEFNLKSAFWKLQCKNDMNQIKFIYNNSITNFSQTLNYIKSLNKLNQTIQTTQTLLNEVIANKQIDNKEIIQLAYFVKQSIDKNGTSSITSQFPPVIQDLIWKCDANQCRLKSEYSKEYLYSAYSKTNLTRRHVYTWIPGDKDLQCNFVFEPQQDGTVFAIKNLHFDEYIHSFDGKTEDEDRRPIFSWIPGSFDEQGLWEIYPVNNGTLVQVKNKFFNEFLYADEPQDEERRKVVTLRLSSS